jgi:cytochrome c553
MQQAPTTSPNAEVVVQTASANSTRHPVHSQLLHCVRDLHAKSPQTKLPKLLRAPADYCPACLTEHKAGTNNDPKRRSHRTDGLCKLHAPPCTQLTAPPRTRLKCKMPPKKLPKLPQRPAAYCPACIREYRAGTNNDPKRRSDRTVRLCATHSAYGNLPSRKRRAPEAELTERKRVRLRSKCPCAQVHLQAYHFTVQKIVKLIIDRLYSSWYVDMGLEYHTASTIQFATYLRTVCAVPRFLYMSLGNLRCTTIELFHMAFNNLKTRDMLA